MPVGRFFWVHCAQANLTTLSKTDSAVIREKKKASLTLPLKYEITTKYDLFWDFLN